MNTSCKVRAQFAAIFITTCMISGCGGGAGIPDNPSPPPPPTYSVSVAVSGLSGSGLTLQNNAGDDLSPTTNGALAFATKLSNGANYAVSIKTQPTSPTQTCTVANGSGAIAGANVTNVTVTCTTNTFTVSGTIFSSGGTLVLQDNGRDDLTLANVGTFTFPTKVASGAAYSVTVKSSPSMPLQTCVTGSNAGGPAAGTVGAADVTNLFAFCSPVALTLGGAVSGLVGSGLVLASDLQTLPVTANGNFQFTAPILSTGSYSVSVQTQPSTPAQTCIVTNGSGNEPTADVTNVQVTCSAPGFACGTENGTVVTHSSNITASETWAGNGTVHLIPNTIGIVAPATVTIQKCAIVKLADNAEIDVHGASSGSSAAKLLAAGDDPVNGVVYFRSTAATSSAAHRWNALRGINLNSLIELHNTSLSDVAPSTSAAAIVMTGSSSLPDPVLTVDHVVLQNLGGPGVHLSNAAFTANSTNLQIHGAAGYALELSAMALGSIPTGDYSGSLHDEALVVDNANIFDNLTIHKRLPIHFITNGVSVVGLAPTFVPNFTLKLDAGVVLKFEGASAPTMVRFGALGQGLADFNATLVAQGTTADPVVFTSAKATPAPGDWAGIWLATSNGSQLDHVIIEYAGADASVGPLNCGPIDPAINQQARHTAPLLVGDGTDLAYVPPSSLITNSTFRNNTGSYAIDSVWQASSFGPVLTSTNTFSGTPKFCTQPRNLDTASCSVGGRGCLVP